MLTLEQALRRTAAVTLGLLAAAGTASAQAPDPDTVPPPEPMPEPMEPIEPMEPLPQDTSGTTGTPMSQPDVDVDVDVDTPPAPTYTPPQQQPYAQPTYTSPAYSADYEEVETTDTTLERYGIGIAAGGGVEGFASETMRDTTDPGGNWNVRVTVGTRSPIAFEGAYIGSAQSIDALGLDDDALLIGNGAQANVRVNVLDANLQPFVYAGAAWRRYDLARSDFNTSAVADSDDVLEIPAGVGLAWKYRGLLLDARGEFRYAEGADMVPSLTGDGTIDDSAQMHRWGVNANIGYAF